MSGKTCANENRCDRSDAGPPETITVDASQVSVRSNLAYASPVILNTPLSPLTPDNMSLPLTPLCQVM